MIVPPRGLVNFAAGVLSARTARRLHRKNPGHADQRRVFADLIHHLATTAFGREAGIEAGMRPETFRSRVAPRTYEMLTPYLERMKRGEAGVLWPGRCSFFALSSGTSAGTSKYLPVTEDLLAHFRRAGVASLLYYTARAGHTGIFLGRHLFLGGSTVLTPIAGRALRRGLRRRPERHRRPQPAGVGGKTPVRTRRHNRPDGRLAGQAPGDRQAHAAPRHHARGRHPELAADPVGGAAGAGGRGTGGRAEPQDALAQSGMPGPRRRAPGPFRRRAARGPGSRRATCTRFIRPPRVSLPRRTPTPALGLRLMVDVGLYFEFLPMTAFDEANLGRLGEKVVPLEEVRVGVDYALLLTTPAGLCRYVIGDVVRFLSTDVPRLIYVGRTSLQLSAFGEHVIERELTESLLAVCRRHGWTIVNFHVAPVFANTLTGQTRGCHEWWLELKVPTVETPTANVICPELDAELKLRNDDYLAKRKGGGMEAPFVRLVMPGVFETMDEEKRPVGRTEQNAPLPLRSQGGRPTGRVVALLRRVPAGPSGAPQLTRPGRTRRLPPSRGRAAARRWKRPGRFRPVFAAPGLLASGLLQSEPVHAVPPAARFWVTWIPA